MCVRGARGSRETWGIAPKGLAQEGSLSPPFFLGRSSAGLAPTKGAERNGFLKADRRAVPANCPALRNRREIYMGVDILVTVGIYYICSLAVVLLSTKNLLLLCRFPIGKYKSQGRYLSSVAVLRVSAGI